VALCGLGVPAQDWRADEELLAQAAVPEVAQPPVLHEPRDNSDNGSFGGKWAWIRTALIMRSALSPSLQLRVYNRQISYESVFNLMCTVKLSEESELLNCET
jgi:hypothetical protein